MKYISVSKTVVKCQPGCLFEQLECILHIVCAKVIIFFLVEVVKKKKKRKKCTLWI